MGSRQNRGKGRGKAATHRPRRGVIRPFSILAAQTSDEEPAVVTSSVAVTVTSSAVAWPGSRSGAAAGRGFHFQEAVGAWLVARLLTEAHYTTVVPEGSHEDVTCVGTFISGIQIKSRQERRDEYPPADIAEFLHQMHAKRVQHPYDGPARLVLERGIRGAPLPEPVTVVGDLDDAHPLKVACASRSKRHELPPGVFDDMVVEVVGFDEARARAEAIVSDTYRVERAVAELIVLRFTQMVRDAADVNAGVKFAERSSLDRSQLEVVAQRTIRETEPSALTEAINSGVCSPLDMSTPLDDDSYFQGVNAQPGHVTAGLPTARPDLVDAVFTGLEGAGAVIISGPSGVGKSTVMWMAADANRHCTWFHVHRLDVANVSSLVTLAEARRPSAAAPVGFLVDDVGLSDPAGWDHLLDRLAAVPNVMLVGTARAEDTFGVTTLAKATLVEVALDEQVAERIYSQLLQGGHTSQPHWREAFEQAAGLTLEYTYFLTQGERLDKVLSAQVLRLVREGAEAELELLALTTTAHMFGAQLPVAAAQAALGLGSSALRHAVGRLHREHFLAERSGVLTGLHLLRSTALSKAAHATPPPTLVSTVGRLTAHLPEESLDRFVFGALRATDTVDAAVIDAVVDRVAASEAQSGLLAAVMHTLRNADFVRHARGWRQVILGAGVAPAYWPVTVDLALIDSELIEDMQPAIIEAVTQLRNDSEPLTPLLDAFVERLGPGRIVEVAAEQLTPGRLAALLTSCGSGPSDLLEALDEVTWAGTQAGAMLVTCSADQFAHLAHVGKLLGPNVNQRMSDAVGGEQAVLDRILAAVPFLVSAEQVTRGGSSVAAARLVFVDDEVTPDIDEAAKDAARLLLRSLPGCENADVRTFRAGVPSTGWGI